MEKTNRLIASRDASNLSGARPEKIPPSLRGLEIRNDPAAGEVFFLDFPFYRTSQDLEGPSLLSTRCYPRSPADICGGTLSVRFNTWIEKPHTFVRQFERNLANKSSNDLCGLRTANALLQLFSVFRFCWFFDQRVCLAYASFY